MFIVEAVKPVFSACTHDGGCAQAAEPKHSHFKGDIDVSSAIPHSIRLFVELLSLLATDTAEVVSPSATSAEFDPTQLHSIYSTVCTLVYRTNCSTRTILCVHAVVRQSVLVDYCCFHLTSGASTVGPYIVHRNKKRSLLSQPLTREEFVEKKYQVFDVCMYGHTYSKSMDQPSKIANPARGQLNRENEYFPVRVRA